MLGMTYLQIFGKKINSPTVEHITPTIFLGDVWKVSSPRDLKGRSSHVNLEQTLQIFQTEISFPNKTLFVSIGIRQISRV